MEFRAEVHDRFMRDAVFANRVLATATQLRRAGTRGDPEMSEFVAAVLYAHDQIASGSPPDAFRAIQENIQVPLMPPDDPRQRWERIWCGDWPTTWTQQAPPWQDQ